MRRAYLLTAMTVIAMSLAASVQAQDDYGRAPSYESHAPAPMATLTWPGKIVPAEQVAQPRYTAAPAQPAPQPAPTSLYDPPPPPRWHAAEATLPATPMPASATASLTQAQPALSAQQAANGAPPRRYSLARQFGVEPDPIALSPQFLATSPQADMAEPPPLPPPHTPGAASANMSSAAVTSQLRQAQEAASDAPTSSLGN